MDGLSGITSVGEDFWIRDNYALTNLDGLSALTSVGNEFSIDGNDILPDCEACEVLDQITNGPTSVDVHDNLDDSCTPVPDSCP